ncbi:MAG: FkbM family methyltransferase [Gammaproteobacteria bacterium]
MFKRLFKKTSPAKIAEKKARKQLFSIKLTANDIAIDCGANVGKITEKLSRNGTTVYSFEPNPFAFKVLQEKFLNSPNVHCFQKGVGIENSMMKLYFHENSDQDEVYWSTGSSLLKSKANVLNEKYQEVEIIDLCEFIQSLNQRIKILKMDVEGVECPIIKRIIESGMIDQIDYLFVETHDHKMPELKNETDEIRQLIKDRGLKNINLDWT